MTPIIRKAKEEDLVSILALNKALFVFEEQFTNTYNPHWTYSETGKNYFLSRIKNEKGIVIIAEEQEEIIGYLIGYVTTYPFRSVNPICEIENMFVQEKQRTKGIGAMLITACKQEALRLGAKRIKVEAFAQNTNAIAFYHKQGFSDCDLILEADIA